MGLRRGRWPVSEVARKNRRGLDIVHGEARNGKWTPEYRAWLGMKGRCHTPTNPKFRDYGARGICVCDEWMNNYQSFLSHVGRRPSSSHSLGRIDNDRGYEPGNVRWETAQQQSRNRRTAIMLTVNGRTMCVAEWARETGVCEGTLLFRVRSGWSDEEVIGKPVPKRRRPAGRLTTEAVIHIRANYGFLTISSLAMTFGVSRRAVDMVVKGENWSHV